MLVWGTNNYSYSYLSSFPSGSAPTLYIHNYDTIYTGLLLISRLLHVHALTNQCKLYYIERDSIDKPSDF